MRKIILECTVQTLARPHQVAISTTLIEFDGHTNVDRQAKFDNFKQKLITEEFIGDALINRRIVEVE